MAQAVQNKHSFIDLTNEYEDDHSFIRATKAACQKALAAATQMTNRNPSEIVELSGKNLVSASVPGSLKLPRPRPFTKPMGVETDGAKKDGKNNAIPPPNISVPSPSFSAIQYASGTAPSRPARSPSIIHNTDRDSHHPREIEPVASGRNAFTTRTPRSAAISAKQNIAEACSELENWGNKDLDLIIHQTGVSTPRKLGRPNDDLDEWSPKSSTKAEEEERTARASTPTKSPMPSAGNYKDSTIIGDVPLSHTRGRSSTSGTRKRRFSGSSQSRHSPLRLNKRSSAYRESYSSISAAPLDGELVRDESGNNSPADSPGKYTPRVKHKSMPEPSNPYFGKPSASTKPTVLDNQVNMEPRLQRGPNIASNTTPAESGLYPAFSDLTYTALFDSVVYPAIRKYKKRHIDSLPPEDIDAIGRITVDKVLKRLAQYKLSPSNLGEQQTERMKGFIKKVFLQEVRRANRQSSHVSAAPADHPGFDTGTLSTSSSKPTATNVSKLTETNGCRSSASDLDHPEKTLSSRATVVDEREGAQALQQSHTTPLEQQSSAPLGQSPSESPMSCFAPGFDRGRYPALRRRRGNKYYTPTKTSKKSSKFEKEQSTSSGHNSNLGLPNGKDQVQLPHALASQPTSLPERALQLTASTTPAEKGGVSTNKGSALEPAYKGYPVTELASNADTSKSPQQVSAQGQGRMSEVGKPFASSRATNQSAQSIASKWLLENSTPQKESRPNFRSQPATALDPSLEYVVAVLVTDTPKEPFEDGQKYTITPANRKQLTTNQSIIKHVDFTSKAGKPRLVRIETKVTDPMLRPGSCISSLLRNRELGLTSRGRHAGTIAELRQLRSEMLEPWKEWKGASGDVVAIAWHPDSNVYAFGAAAHTNVEDIQYNRPCNLLLGNLASNQVRELPDHRVDRPRPETISHGPNSNPAVYDACDPKVYETVTSIAFSPTGDRMFTASHDCTVKIWDVSNEKFQCLSTLRHEAWVTSVEISEQQPGLFATASKSVNDAVRIYHDSSIYVSFSASRAVMKPEWKIYPECLRWGPNSSTSHLLLAGFQQWEQQVDSLSAGGQLCLYDARAFEIIKVSPSSQSVYAAAWHPTEPFFATGGTPGNNVIDKINTKTVVRVWDVRTPKRCHVEYECPAADMQDITFCPVNSNVVTAGCTDGNSYIWDWRWPDEILHRLKHGRPLAELDHTREREDADTGVMLSLWGPGGSLYYTGSSDGMIKAWDVRRHPNDVLISNVANFDVSIQSGAFSPDGDHLLVGDAEGGIHFLSSAPSGPRSNNKSTDAYIDLVRAADGSGIQVDHNDDNPGTEGIEAAKSLVKSGQLEYNRQLGVGKGDNYQGPYAAWARKDDGKSPFGRLRKKYEKRQPITKRGEKNWNVATPMTTLLHERRRQLGGDKGGLYNFGSKTAQPSQGGETLGASPLSSTSGGALSAAPSSAHTSVGPIVADGGGNGSVEYNMIPESEMIEENYWWTRMGEEEIDEARAGRVKY